MDEKRREKSAEKKRREGKSCGEERKVIEGGGEDGIMRCRFRDDAEEKERNERREEGG